MAVTPAPALASVVGAPRPSHDRGTLLVAGTMLVALTLLATAWRAPALAPLRGTITAPWPAARPAELVPALPLLHTFDGHTMAVTAIAFSSDGALLASASPDGTVRLWNTATGRSRRVLQRNRLHSGDATPVAVAVSRSGALVAIGDLDGVVSAWDTATGRQLRAPPKRAGHAAWSLAFHPRDATLAIGYVDGVVVQWDLLKDRELRALPPREHTLWTVAFSPDGRTLATGGAYTPLTLWDAATGRDRRTLTLDTPAWAVAFSPDSGLLAVAGDDGVALRDVATGVATGTLRTGSTRAVGFSPDGTVLMTGGPDGVVRSWDATTSRALRAARVPEPVALLALAPRRMHVATVARESIYGYGADTTTIGVRVHLWDTRLERS